MLLILALHSTGLGKGPFPEKGWFLDLREIQEI